MNKILIPTDFSSTAEKAYKLAAKLATVTEAELIFVHVITNSMRKAISVNFSSIANITEYNIEDETLAATELLSRIKENPLFENLIVRTQLVNSTLDIPSAIAVFEEENEIDLVISGTDSARTTRRNYAPILVRTAKCPVITVEGFDDDNELKNLVVATDFINVNYRMMDKIWAIQQLFESQLTVLYVNTPKHFRTTENIENEYNLFISKYELDVDNTSLFVYADHTLEDGLLKYIAKEKTDMVLMSTHGRSGLSGLFTNSHAEYIVGHAKMPVYVHNLYVDQSYDNVSPDLGSFNF